MLLKPINEISLRHLFSKNICEKITGLSYLSPITNSAGKTILSPDALILDKRTAQTKILKCEFKFMPVSYTDFANNGQFDIAIVWEISSFISKEKLLNEISVRNGCKEIVVLSEYVEFRSLLSLNEIDDFNSVRLNNLEEIERLLVKKDIETAFIAYLAAKIYPHNFRMDKMVKLLADDFTRIQHTHAKGRAGIVTALLQTKPQLIKHMYSNHYKWNDEFDPKLAMVIIGELLATRFEFQIPAGKIIEIE